MAQILFRPRGRALHQTEAARPEELPSSEGRALAFVPMSGESRLPYRLRTRMAARIGALLIWTIFAVAVLAILLVLVGPRFLPYRVLPLRGSSMEPTIRKGSAVVLVRVRADRLAVGDIITFHPPGPLGVLITHRIVRIENTQEGVAFVTKGDANGAPDSWRVSARGNGLRYAFSIPYLGYAVSGASRPSVRVAVLIFLAVLLAVLVLARVWRSGPAGQPQLEPASPHRREAALPEDTQVCWGHPEKGKASGVQVVAASFSGSSRPLTQPLENRVPDVEDLEESGASPLRQATSP